MTLYVESSAVVAWLFGESTAEVVAACMADSGSISTSEMTLVECDRAILRWLALGQVGDDVAQAWRARLSDASQTWSIESLAPSVIIRARAPFPRDAIRALDAIHLATAVVVREAGTDLDVLSLDERVRANAAALGFRVVPA